MWPMPTCAACGTANPEGFRFCGVCGTPLGEVRCGSCGVLAPPGHRFCGQCGASLLPAAAATASPVPAWPGGAVAAPTTSLAALAVPDERKLATVLFADVVGFTSLSEGTDPEVVARTVDAAFRRMAEVVVEHGGTVDKYLGDCLMAVFGVPQAHDDDAERAVAAGLTMGALGADLAFSIGINSGEVMVTAVGREGEVTVIGDTVNVAARLEKAAGPGEVLIGRLTRQLAADRIVTRERQPVVLKGKRDPVEVWEAIDVVQAEQRTSTSAQPPFVGREDELAFLRSQWRRCVRDRRSGVVLLCGEAGLGKTRLIDELAGELTGAGPGAEAEPMIIRAVFPAYGSLGGRRLAAQIVGQLGPSGDPEVNSRAASLADPESAQAGFKSVDSQTMEQELLWAFRRLVEEKAGQRPLLVVIDDIHRAEDATLNRIGELVAGVADVPLLVVLGGRPAPRDWLDCFRLATTVHLEPLSPGESATLVEMLARGALPPATVAALAVRGGGNPLHLRELVTTVKGHPGDPFGGIGLPPTLQAVLAARLDALPPLYKQCLQNVAVLGELVTDDQVAALGTDRPAEALAALVSMGLLRHHRDGTYEVADPLMREVAYETLPRQLRGEQHRRAADVVPSALDRARHLDRAAGYLPNDAPLAAEAATALAAEALQLLDANRPVEGAPLLQRAVELGHDRPHDIVRLARALSDTSSIDEALATLERLPEDSGDPVLDADRIHARGAAQIFRDAAAALVDLEEATKRWADLGLPRNEAWAHANRGVALFFVGRSGDAERELRTALEQFAPLKDRSGQIAVYRFWSLLRPDDPRVVGWLDEALRYAEELGDRTGQLNSLNALSWNQYFRLRLGGPDDIAPVGELVHRMIQLAEELGSPELHAYSLAIMADMARLAGQLDEAADSASRLKELLKGDSTSPVVFLSSVVSYAVGRARGQSAELPTLPDSPDPIVSLATAILIQELVLQGEFDAARQFSRQLAVRPPLQTLERLTAGLLRGLVDLLDGDPDAARPPVTELVETARRVEAIPALAIGLAMLAEVAVRVDGDRDAADALLAELKDHAPGGLAEAMVQRAGAVLGRPGAADALRLSARRLAAPALLITHQFEE
jgi:class 3 adenylate cyclase/tetratricopeptide (TPR) repeat protein